MEAIIWMQQFANPILDILAQAITILGEDVFAILVCALYLWCIDQNFGYRAGFVMIASGTINGVLKNIFKIPRPWERNFPGYMDPLRKSTATGYSFPSGHSQSGAVVMGMLCKRWKKTAVRIALVALALLIGISRIYCRVHTWQDVAMGLALGFTCVFALDALCVFLMKKSPWTMLWMLLPTAVFMILFPVEGVYKMCGMLAAVAVGYGVERTYIQYDVKAKLPVQILKMAVGLGITLAIKSGLKPIIGDSLAADAFRYFCIGMFVCCGAPALFQWAAKLWEKHHAARV